MLGNYPRRRADRILQRMLFLMTALAIAVGTLASYLGFRALRAMDATQNFALDAYNLGKKIGRAPSYAPSPETNE